MTGTTALVLSGGGARAAYQVGFLRCLARRMPEARLPIITGVSAGAINAAYLASHRGTPGQAAEELCDLWGSLSPQQVYRVGTGSLAWSSIKWLLRLSLGGSAAAPRVRGLLDTQPLRKLLERVLQPRNGIIPGIAENLAEGRLRAAALTGLRYSTGQTVTWIQGSDLEAWERPNRVGVTTELGIQHVMASASLPLLFPAEKVDGGWYGDGGVRMSAPLSPAIHLGADRMIAISTRYPRSRDEADEELVRDYPPPVTVAGTLLNAIFLDAVDQDALRLDRVNQLLEKLPAEEREGLRPIRLMVLRPSRDLGRLAAEYEPELPKTFRFLTRGLGTRETKSPDFLSLLMFQGEYLQRLIEIGEADAEARVGELEAFLG